eukprot:15435007-Alexandrium_andersonii.AAC.1
MHAAPNPGSLAFSPIAPRCWCSALEKYGSACCAQQVHASGAVLETLMCGVCRRGEQTLWESILPYLGR